MSALWELHRPNVHSSLPPQQSTDGATQYLARLGIYRNQLEAFSNLGPPKLFDGLVHYARAYLSLQQIHLTGVQPMRPAPDPTSTRQLVGPSPDHGIENSYSKESARYLY